MKKKSNKSIQIISGIMLTLICLGPFGNLIFSILTHEFENILCYAIATFPTLIIIGAYWCWYIMIFINIR